MAAGDDDKLSGDLSIGPSGGGRASGMQVAVVSGGVRDKEMRTGHRGSSLKKCVPQ